ncbi:MAG: hypothetical protein KDA92_13450 [Planctomycetales bacterium]|nr:hypothetical protein [Planctomycetales bacterium]
MSMSPLLRRIGSLMLSLTIGVNAVYAGNWITAPQLCRGKPYSSGARAAAWDFDLAQRLSYVTKDSRTMYASVHPGDQADFVIQLRLQLGEQGGCRILLDDTALELTNAGQGADADTQLSVRERMQSFKSSKLDEGKWTTFKLSRRDLEIAVEVNEQRCELELPKITGAVQRIGLQATRGKLAVSNFVLTGDLQIEHRNVAP